MASSDDLISRLTRGIGIINEKLDHILQRIEHVESRVGVDPPAEIERTVRDIVDDLNTLEHPIAELFEDVETLKQRQHPEAGDFHRQLVLLNIFYSFKIIDLLTFFRVLGLHQRRNAYLARLNNQILPRIGVHSQEISERYASTRTNAFQRVEEAIRWVRERLDKLNKMQFSETLEVLEDMFEKHKLDNRDIQDFRQTVDQCIARQVII